MPLPARGLDEVGDLLGALGVDDAAEARPLARPALDQPALVGDHADRPIPRCARRRRSSPCATSGWNSSSAPSSSDGRRARGACRRTCGDRAGGGRRDRSPAGPAGARRASRWRHAFDARQPADVLADPLEARRVVRGAVVRDGADLGVRPRAAERLGVDGLAGRALHQVGPAESHEGGALRP